MNTSLLLAGAVVAALVTGAHAAEPLTFDVTFNDSFITAKPDAFSAGDRIIINDVLLQAGKQVGTTSGVCTITDPATGSAICNVTFLLADGAVSIQFVNAPPPEKHFAIIGGTAAHAGASGSGTLIEHGDNTGTLTLNIE